MNSEELFCDEWPHTIGELQDGGFLSKGHSGSIGMFYALIFDHAKRLLQGRLAGGNTTFMALDEAGVREIASKVFEFPEGARLFIARVYPYGSVQCVKKDYPVVFYEGCVHCKGKSIIPAMGGNHIRDLCYWDPEDEYGIQEFIV